MPFKIGNSEISNNWIFALIIILLILVVFSLAKLVQYKNYVIHDPCKICEEKHEGVKCYTAQSQLVKQLNSWGENLNLTNKENG